MTLVYNHERLCKSRVESVLSKFYLYGQKTVLLKNGTLAHCLGWIHRLFIDSLMVNLN